MCPYTFVAVFTDAFWCVWGEDFAVFCQILPMQSHYFLGFQWATTNSGSAYRGSNPWGAAISSSPIHHHSLPLLRSPSAVPPERMVSHVTTLEGKVSTKLSTLPVSDGPQIGSSFQAPKNRAVAKICVDQPAQFLDFWKMPATGLLRAQKVAFPHAYPHAVDPLQSSP